MKSEALHNIRTMQNVKTNSDIWRGRKLRTTNSLSKTEEQEEFLSAAQVNDLAQTLNEEKARLARFDRSVEKSRENVLRSREKLAAIINKNRVLMDLRHEMQQMRRNQEPDPAENVKRDDGSAEEGIHKIDLDY